LLKIVTDIASMRCRSDTNVAELNSQTKSAFFAKTCPFRLLGCVGMNSVSQYLIRYF